MSQLLGFLLRTAIALPIAGILLVGLAVVLAGELLNVARRRNVPAHRHSEPLRVVAPARTPGATRRFSAG
jgi:hypothetical protein